MNHYNMPKFHPTTLIQDCWSSIGNITFFHRNGQCYYKRKPYTQYHGTFAQLAQAQIHHRAILAWQQLPHSIQLQWRELALTVPSHRPPFDNHHHISGYNLFVSAYHGFAQLGSERIPVPQPFPQFPISHLQLLYTESENTFDALSIHCRLILHNTPNPNRWHPIAKIQLSHPGQSYRQGYMRTYVGIRNCNNDIIFNISEPDANGIILKLRYRLIDSITGYRNNWKNYI